MLLTITTSDELFKQYVKHVLRWEGKLSNDPDDTASSCAPFKGAYHTNKGVTFCTFKKNAKALGIAPVTYERFMKLTDEDIAGFVMIFCKSAEASELPTLLALSVTEAAWGSGPRRAIKHLQDALNNLGAKVDVDGDMGPQTEKAVLLADPDALYREYWKERQEYLDMLTRNPKYDQYKNGWNNRVNDFLKIFPEV